MISGQTERKSIMTRPEVERFLADADRERLVMPDARLALFWWWAPIVVVYTGLKMSEVARLRKADFDVVPYDADLPVRIVKAGELRNQRRIPLHAHLYELGLLQVVGDASDYLFLHDAPDIDRQANALERRCAARRSALTLVPAGASLGILLRRRFFEDLIKAGASAGTAAIILGRYSGTEPPDASGRTIGYYARTIQAIPRYRIPGLR